MGGAFDESMLSTASTLIDSYAASLDDSLDGDGNQVDKGKGTKVNPLICRGKVNSFAKGRILTKNWNSKIKSPNTTAVNLEIDKCADDKSERSAGSKLDLLRARTSLLRKLGSAKIEESRASLRKSRTISIGSQPSSGPSSPEPAPSEHKILTPSTIQQEHSEKTKEFSDFLRRSNNVIDRLSTEIAMAGSIINENSCHADTTFNDTSGNMTNDFTSNLYGHNISHEIGKGQKSIAAADDSIHNISVGEENWDQTTISATFPGSSSSSVSESREGSCKVSSSKRLSSSGLPPPEVLVKRTTPRASSRAAPRADAMAPRAEGEDRYRRQRNSSVHSRGDCASMYNTNQKCEKLALENDCLKRQLDLLESRHRDSQKKLIEKLQLQEKQDVRQEQYSGTISTSKSIISKSTTFGFHRKKKKNIRRRFLMILVLGSFLLLSTLWLYRSTRNASLSGISDSTKASRRQSFFGESVSSHNSDSADIEDDTLLEGLVDEPDTVLIVHKPSTKHQKSHSAKQKESNKVNRLKRFFSRMKISNGQNPVGVWLTKHQQIKTKEHHAEL